MPESFSLLMAVWSGDQAKYVRRAFRSAVDDQTLPPDQVVIVQDGPVSLEISTCLQEIRRTSTVPVTVVELATNEGLGRALDRGLDECWYDIVARMDADDVSVPDRFERQLRDFSELDLTGAGIYEFAGDTNRVVGVRIPPVDYADIVRYARIHDPFNHPTVVFRRAAVSAAGGYGDLPMMEDYALFARMINNGARVANLAEPLVYYRVGEEAFKRRGGTRLLRSELRLQREFLAEGFVSWPEFLRNIAIRGGYRLVPWWVRRGLYRRMLSVNSKRLGRLERVETDDQPLRWRDEAMTLSHYEAG